MITRLANLRDTSKHRLKWDWKFIKMAIVDEVYCSFVRCFDDEYILRQKEKKPNVDNKILYVRLLNTRGSRQGTTKYSEAWHGTAH